MHRNHAKQLSYRRQAIAWGTMGKNELEYEEISHPSHDTHPTQTIAWTIRDYLECKRGRQREVGKDMEVMEFSRMYKFKTEHVLRQIILQFLKL